MSPLVICWTFFNEHPTINISRQWLVICIPTLTMHMWTLSLMKMLQVDLHHHVVFLALVFPYSTLIKTSWKIWPSLIILGIICTIMRTSFHRKLIANILWSPKTSSMVSLIHSITPYFESHTHSGYYIITQCLGKGTSSFSESRRSNSPQPS